MNLQEKLQLMADVKKNITNYLEDQLGIEIDALKTYEDKESPLDAPMQDQEIKKIREQEAIKIRDRIYQIKRHIAVIKRM